MVASPTTQLGTWLATQACALTGNQIGDLAGWHSIHWATPDRANSLFITRKFIFIFFLLHTSAFIFKKLLFNYNCLIFPTLLSPALPAPHPTTTVNPHYYGFVVARGSLTRPFPFFPCYPPLPSPLVTVSLFLISLFLVLFCSFVCFVH